MAERRIESMCPHCGWRFAYEDAAANPFGSGLVPEHDYGERPYRRVCPGTNQNPRNPDSDRRPLWKDLPCTYTVYPCKGEALHTGGTLLVMDMFPPNVRLVMVRHASSYQYCGYIEGDGAQDLREKGVRRLRVESVSEVSGCGQARAEAEGGQRG